VGSLFRYSWNLTEQDTVLAVDVYNLDIKHHTLESLTHNYKLSNLVGMDELFICRHFSKTTAYALYDK
jgi:hypothetical protein